jgi:hypothetical protein
MAALAGSTVAEVRSLAVAAYRAYFVNSDGHFERFRAFVCNTDENAIVWARQLMDHQPVELWSGTRMVTSLSSPDNGQAVTYEIHEVHLVPNGTQ